MLLDAGGELEDEAAGLDSRMRETQPDMRSQGADRIIHYIHWHYPSYLLPFSIDDRIIRELLFPPTNARPQI